MDLSTPRLKIDPQDKGEGTLEANGTTLEAKGSIPEWQPKANDTTTDKFPVHGRGQFKTNSYENNDQITDALKKWAETNPLYCSVCLPVTRDIGILTIPPYHPTWHDGSEFIIYWEVKLCEIADAAERGCAFCALVIARLIPVLPPSTRLGNEVLASEYGCCHLAIEIGDRVKHAVRSLRSVCNEYGQDAYVAILAKTDEALAAAKTLEKVRFIVHDSNLPVEVLRQVVAPGGELAVEMFGLEGQTPAEWLKDRPLNVTPCSDAGIQLAKDWLRECVDTRLPRNGNTIASSASGGNPRR